MTPPTLLKLMDLETHIDDLQHQKSLLQNIERFTDNRIDFGDLLETYMLLVEEIERLREKLREQKQELPVRGKRCAEEEEEETSSSKYNIEHVIKDKDGLRPVKPEDLDMEHNKGVKEAFKVVYECQKQCKAREQASEEEEEVSSSSNRFEIKDQRFFQDLVRSRAESNSD